jgi:predicted AlkP superfamily pyrophosphatase or phosphodiesterase
MPLSTKTTVIAAVLVTGLAAGCMRATASAVDGTPVTQGVNTPKLVVFITVDQLRGDYPVKFGPELRAGLQRLTRGGAWFTNAFHDHAITETAPGHASPLSGRFPRSTGITSNSVGVVDPNFSLIGALPNETGASPLRFQGSSFYDWLFVKNRSARALSVSMKDRGAILPIGRAKQDVYWYSSNGSFTTSDYYRRFLPAWVKAFNARHLPHSYANAAWRLSRDTLAYKEPDDVQHENRQLPTDNVFPHAFPPDPARAAIYLRSTPAMDSVTALFALEGLRQTGIGRGTHTDLMAVSFSALDYIGHSWGPDSREVHEAVLRLDETIGWFIDSLYKLRDSASIVIALTGDHGVSPIPELARERGEATGDQGLRVSLRPLVAEVRAALQHAGIDPTAFVYDGELVGVDRAQFARTKIKPDSLLDAFAAAARQVRGVARVDRLSAIRRADFAMDPVARRWSHQVPDDIGVELVITLTKYSYWSATITATHGSPYDLDASVPIIFYGAGVKAGQYSLFARTVDIGPTLAALVRVAPTEKIDGVVLMDTIVR